MPFSHPARILLQSCPFWLFAVSAVFSQDPIKFGRDVRPILAKHCLACHGPDESARESDLRLDERKAAVAAGAIEPGDPQGSLLIQRILSTDPDEVMPPPSTNESLEPGEKEILQRWIKQGAVYEKHWAFELPRQKELPKVNDTSWPINPVDHFVLRQIEKQGMTPSADAERMTWIRRVSLDLTGLPPTVEQAEDFLADRSAKAYEKVVDRLLQSDAYGEHWARMWLDLARYADTRGYEKDRHRDIWRYRDWVIDAFDADMPFDQFTREQLAGDLIPDRNANQILATAFHRNTMTNEEGGTDNEEFRVAAVKDRVDTTIQVWMGLTMGCSKCHSHKYDPISIRDYYSFYAFFNQTQDNDNEGPFWPTPTKEQADKISRLNQSIAEYTGATQNQTAAFKAAFDDWRKPFDSNPLWNSLKLVDSESQHDVKFVQGGQGRIVAQGKRPAKDVWTLTFDLAPFQKVNSLRIDHYPKAMGGGDWPDANIAIQELEVDLIDAAGKKTRLKLKNPRASFSQQGWQVDKAIDGNKKVGWALSPNFAKPQVAVFDFQQPITGAKLVVRLVQEYGQSLLLARSRFSVSTYSTKWNLPSVKEDLKDVFAREVHSPTRKAFQRVEQLQRELTKIQKAIPKTPVMLELDPSKTRKTRIHQRGNFLDPTESVDPTVLTVFGKMPKDAPANRLGVSDWLMADTNPLTGRVMVNRIWARIFGVGIVETEEDFGTQGLLPSHPDLLDWLAVEFRQQGWSIKRLLKMIVMSRTYRQTSRTSQQQLKQDPRNRWLARGPRFRLSAETVRDQALAASGLLSRKKGGPSVMPPQPDGIWKSTYNGQSWVNATGPDRFRRAIYTYLKRTSPYPAMQTFDAGSGEVCQIRRVRTNTPLQALVVLNDQAFLEAAGGLATLMSQASTKVSEQLETGFRQLLIRKPTARESRRLLQLFQEIDLTELQHTELLKAAGLKEGDARLVIVANVLLNLDEVLTKP